MSNYIYEYYQKIEDGSITTGRWIKLWYKYIVKGLEDKSFYYDQKKSNKAIKFIENFCRHHEGALAPQLIKLELWQKAFISVLFGIVDSEGYRQFREVLLVMGRKNGKTLLGASICAYCSFLDGEYGGRIYMSAPKLQQASLCFDAFYQMVQKEPELDALCQKRRTDIYIKESNTTISPLAFSFKKSDGLNISVGICDEVASWHGDGGLKFYEVLKSSVGARKQPLILSISTAGYENESIYDELIKRATRVLLGDSQETRFAPFLYMIDDPNEWNSLTELEKSNPNLGVSITADYLLEEIAIAEGSMSKATEFKVKYCNIKQNSSLAWLSTQTIQKSVCEHYDLEQFRSSYAVGGIDLSQTTDLTACSCAIEKDGIIYLFCKFFLPTEKIGEATERDGLPYQKYIQQGILQPSGENFVDYNDCFAWFRELVEKYEIYPLVTGYDRYSAQYLVQDMKTYGFVMDDVYQGDNLYGVLMEFEGLMKDGRIRIGDNDLLKVHLLNSAIKMNQDRGRGKLVKLSAKDHIDGVASVIDAMTVRQKWFAQYGEQLANR